MLSGLVWTPQTTEPSIPVPSAVSTALVTRRQRGPSGPCRPRLCDTRSVRAERHLGGSLVCAAGPGRRGGLHALKRPWWPRRQLHLDPVPGSDDAAEHDDTHDSRTAYQHPLSVSVAHLFQQAGPERFDLCARVAQTSHRNESLLAKAEYGADGQVVDLDALRRDVLAQVARPNLMSSGRKHVEELGGDEVNLPEIGLGGVGSDTRAVLHESPSVCVASDSDTCDELDLGDCLFREAVPLAQVECHDRSHRTNHGLGVRPSTRSFVPGRPL